MFSHLRLALLLASLGSGITWAATTTDGWPQSLTFYDYDGDGVMEIVYYNSQKKGVAFDVLLGAQKKFIAADLSFSGGYMSEYVARVANLDNSGCGTVLLQNISKGYSRGVFSYGTKFLQLKADGTAKVGTLPVCRFVVDANADGLPDLYSYPNLGDGDHGIAYRQADGTYAVSHLQTTTATDDVYTEFIARGSWISSLPSLSDGWMIGGYQAKAFDKVGSAVDINQDGYPDLMDTELGGVLYRIGDGKYYASRERGTMQACNLDGDGKLDFILFDQSEGNVVLLFNKGNGQYERKSLMQNKNISRVYFYDFDGDGDIDILLPFDHTTTSGYAFLVFYRNDGNGVFKKKEVSFTDQYQFFDCRDVDGDGLYEVFAGPTDEKRTGDLVMLKCRADFTATPTTICSSLKHPGLYKSYAELCAIGDIDNDGYTEIVVEKNDNTTFFDRFTGKNTAPQPPTELSAAVDPETGMLRIVWNAGSDKETSACDLAYEVRVGTKQGGADIVGTTSLADGRRRSLDEGNAGRALQKLLNPERIADGAVYVAVQAIDAGGLGSAWREIKIDYRRRAASLAMSHREMSTADTLLLSGSPVVEGAAYMWSVADGRIISQEGNTAKVVFASSGNRSIGLTVTASGRELQADAQTVSVAPFAYHRGYVNNPLYGTFADFDQDGYPDMVAQYGVYANDGKGNFSKVAKSYNSDLSKDAKVLDFDRDGYPDFLADEDKGNVFINSGEGDFDFEYGTETFSIEGDGSTGTVRTFAHLVDTDYSLDMDNDGCPDFYDTYNGMFFDMGDNRSFIHRDVLAIGSSRYKWSFKHVVDFDRDGFEDIILWGKETDDPSWSFRLLRKDDSAGPSFDDPQLIYMLPDSIMFTGMEGSLLADVNSDGYVDIIYKLYKENNLYVVVGKAELPYTEVVKIPLVGDYEYEMNYPYHYVLHDYDNNGYPDIPLDIKDSNAMPGEPSYAILMMKPGLEAELLRTNFAYYNRTDKASFLPVKEGAYPDLCSYYGVGYTLGLTDNAAPNRPLAVAARQTATGVELTWQDGGDDHTPAMQMRYNVSVKKKGATGPGAYLISPMNGLDDKACIVPGYLYKKATRMLLPLSVLEAGTAYEVQVQAIDAFNAHSPMTAPVEFTVQAAGYIKTAGSVGVGKDLELSYEGTQASTFSYDLGADGSLVTDEGNGKVTARWLSPGVKEVALTADGVTLHTSVRVASLADVAFSLPSEILAGAYLTVEAPEGVRSLSKKCGFRSNDSRALVKYVAGDTIAVMHFSEPGEYTIEAYVDDALEGNVCSRTAVVATAMPEAALSGVTASAEGYRVAWDTQTLPPSVSAVEVERETERSGEFSTAATVTASAGAWTDLSSSPAIRSERYRLRLVTSNGQKSEGSVPHKPLHLMINRVANGFNLSWNVYEGRDVASYTVWRGSSVGNLQQVTTLAGTQQSYTDLAVPDGDCYYAVSPVFATGRTAAAIRASAGSALFSNVVCSADALSATLTTSLHILALEPEVRLSDANQQLHLCAELLPVNALLRRVSWSVVEGGDLAAIDQNGVLRALVKGTGTVTVRAQALDGSGVSAVLSVPCEVSSTAVESVLAEPVAGWKLLVAREGADVVISGWDDGEDVTLYVVSAAGIVVDMVRTSGSSLRLRGSNYAAGTYVVKAVTRSKTQTCKIYL